MLRLTLALGVFAAFARADLYMHTPRGSNNRGTTENDDKNVQNNNRLFDSQNNNAGGYDLPRTPLPRSYYDISGESADFQKKFDPLNPMRYYVGSRLTIEWSTQHACGKDSTVHCEMVLQYMCEDQAEGYDTRDGTGNEQVDFDPENPDNTFQQEYGLHENWYDYHSCTRRQRNKGLFWADQTPGGETARFTRQDDNGNENGLECNEERDYYPYWAPSPWIDVAIMTNDVDRCDYYYERTANTNSRYQCVDTLTTVGQPAKPEVQRPITQQSCESMQQGGDNRKYTWQETAPKLGFKRDALLAGDIDVSAVPPHRPFWNAGVPAERRECRQLRELASQGVITSDEADKKCLGLLGAPDCVENQWSRDNHLGFVRGGFFANYTWVIPNHVSNACVIRLRYNISTGDYPGWNTFSDKNEILEQDPYVYWGWTMPMELALNTDQYGRTFQDRSFVFAIEQRPANIPAAAVIHNVQVRGKRGHGTQNFPSPTYDFTPKYLHIKQGDFVHWQWEGASSVPSQFIGGGREGTERHNIVQIPHMKANWPATGLTGTSQLFQNDATRRHFAMAGQEQSNPGSCLTLAEMKVKVNYNENEDNEGDRWEKIQEMREDQQNCAWLNIAPARFWSDPIQFNNPGEYFYMSTRDNHVNMMHAKAALYVE